MKKAEIIKIIEEFDTPINIIFCWVAKHNKDLLMNKISRINILLKEVMKEI